MRVPLPVGLIRQIDDLIYRRVGGFETRSQFIADAVEALALELTYPAAEESVEPLRSPQPTAASPTILSPHLIAAPAETALRFTSHDVFVAASGPTASDPTIVKNEPLFGLHNRDYPSLWAATILGEVAAKGPIRFDEFLDIATKRAWEFAASLSHNGDGWKRDALFPTNRDKRQSAEAAFRTFAVGSITRRGSTFIASGPLFLWRIAQVVIEDSEVSVALTPEGRDLLIGLYGLSLELPHPFEHTRKFFNHLSYFAPSDHAAFVLLLRAGADEPTRRQLVDMFHDRYVDWSEIAAATNAAGYVARAREWGLIEQRQRQGRYILTREGQAFLLEALR